jgi:transcriptional regulator with XRE-family HTH domain
MIRAGLILEDLASESGISASAWSMKLNGKSPITVDEAKLFKKIVGSEMPLEELFKSFEEVG